MRPAVAAGQRLSRQPRAVIVGAVLGEMLSCSVAADGAAVTALAAVIWRWLAEPHAVLEAALYAVFAVVLVSSVRVAVLVLRRELGRTPLRAKFRRAAPRALPQARMHATAVPVRRPAQPLADEAPSVIAQAPPQVIEQHLHIHVNGADELPR